MIFKKREEKDYSGKKYLLIIIMLMLLVAIVLGLADIFNKDKNEAELSFPSFDELLENSALSEDSYITENTPFIEDGDRIIGYKDAPLKIFVYEDYNDVFSADFSDTITRIIRENNDKIAVVARPYIGASSESKDRAIMLYCASLEGKWVETRDYFFSSLQGDSIEKPLLVSDCLTENEKLEMIENLKKQAKEYGVYGSPTIFMGNEIIVGARPYDNYVNSNGKTIEGMNELVKTVLTEERS